MPHYSDGKRTYCICTEARSEKERDAQRILWAYKAARFTERHGDVYEMVERPFTYPDGQKAWGYTLQIAQGGLI